jgi:hypothetical protein
MARLLTGTSIPSAVWRLAGRLPSRLLQNTKSLALVGGWQAACRLDYCYKIQPKQLLQNKKALQSIAKQLSLPVSTVFSPPEAEKCCRMSWL